METALHFAPQLLLVMMIPAGLIFFGVFFAAVTAERRRRNKVTRAILGQLEPMHEKVPHLHEELPRSRYAYAMEQMEREPLVYQNIQPIYFRGRDLTQRGR
jgi:hypothetical protein